MSNVNAAIMTKQEERDLEWEKFIEDIRSHIKVVDNLPSGIADDDPVLLWKEQQILKSFYETPPPAEVLKRMGIID